MVNQKKKNVRGQRANTRSNLQRSTVEFNQKRLLQIYSSSRDALLSLGKLDGASSEERFPPLTKENLFRKFLYKRSLGDTNRPDARLWVLGVSTAAAHTYSSTPAALSPPFRDPGASHSAQPAIRAHQWLIATYRN